MRKWSLYVVLAALIALLSSCAHGRRGGELRQVRDSAHKMEVSLTVDLTPLNEYRAKKEEERRKRDEERRKKEEEAKGGWPKWLPKLLGQPVAFIDDVPVVLDSQMMATELYIKKTSRDSAKVGWTGTGWVAGHDPGVSYVMTAGHVCESAPTFDIEIWDIDWEMGTIDIVKIKLPITERSHVMVNPTGVESANAKVLRDEDLDEDFNGNDLCMLGVAGDLGPALAIADEDPSYGQTCSVVGAPTGLWGGGIAVASEALYSGRGSVFGVEPDGLAFNGHLAPGNSGSAVVCDGEVVGVISLGSTRFRSLTHAVPHESIREFMHKAMHR